jgi:hypothetical protein
MGAVKDELSPGKDASTVRYAAASLAFASELIHLWVLPGQLVAAMLPGAFFFLVAVGQGLLVALLALLFRLRRGRHVG